MVHIAAHTDTDSFVYVPDANVLAIGDTGQSNLQYDLAITDLGPLGMAPWGPVTFDVTQADQRIGVPAGTSFGTEIAVTRIKHILFNCVTARAVETVTVSAMIRDLEAAATEVDALSSDQRMGAA